MTPKMIGTTTCFKIVGTVMVRRGQSSSEGTVRDRKVSKKTSNFRSFGFFGILRDFCLFAVYSAPGNFITKLG